MKLNLFLKHMNTCPVALLEINPKCFRMATITRSVYTIQPCTSLQHHLIQSHIDKVHVCLAVSCHLHFWQNDWDFLCVRLYPCCCVPFDVCCLQSTIGPHWWFNRKCLSKLQCRISASIWNFSFVVLWGCQYYQHKCNAMLVLYFPHISSASTLQTCFWHFLQFFTSQGI